MKRWNRATLWDSTSIHERNITEEETENQNQNTLLSAELSQRLIQNGNPAFWDE